MRTQEEFTSIQVTKATHERLCGVRDHFQEAIGGGKWSLGDAVKEMIKILDGLEWCDVKESIYELSKKKVKR